MAARCARIGLKSGQGLTGAIRRHYPWLFVYVASLLLLVANVFKISADLAGIVESASMLTGVRPTVFVRV